MSIMKNVTEGIYPFQLTPYQKATADKFKHDTMFLVGAGRGVGKSTLNYYYSKLRNNNLCNEILLPMKPEPKYKFSRAKWYEFEVPYPVNSAIFDWCEEQFGPEPTKPDAWSRWSYAWRIIKFRDEKDYAWFLLRWG